MKKTFIAIFFLLLVFALMIAGCSNEEEKTQDLSSDAVQSGDIPGNPDEYVDEQIVDENESMEIGELI